MMFTFLKALGHNIGKSLCEDDKLDLAKELLQEAEKKRLTLLSITDHNTINAYYELKGSNIRNLFGGDIISGIKRIKCFRAFSYSRRNKSTAKLPDRSLRLKIIHPAYCNIFLRRRRCELRICV